MADLGDFSPGIRQEQPPVEEDTKILAQSSHRSNGGIVYLLENWWWVSEGIKGQSAVLLTSQVLNWSDDDLRKFVSAELGSDIGVATISRSWGD